MEAVSVVCTIISTVVVAFPTIYLFISKHDAVQVRFTNDYEKSISTVTLRNMSNKTVYIDYIGLYRYEKCSIDLMESLKTKSLAIDSNKDFAFEITSEELQQFLSKIVS